MEAKTKKGSNKAQSSVAGIVLFLFAAAFMLYVIVPNAGTLISKNIAVGRIEHIDSNSIAVIFTNKSDSKDYSLYRKIDFKLGQYLMSNDKTIEVAYSTTFPEAAYLRAVERDKSMISVVIILVIISTAYLIIKNDLLNRSR